MNSKISGLQIMRPSEVDINSEGSDTKQQVNKRRRRQRVEQQTKKPPQLHRPRLYRHSTSQTDLAASVSIAVCAQRLQEFDCRPDIFHAPPRRFMLDCQWSAV